MTPLLSFIVTYHNESLDLLLACLESIKSLPLGGGEAEVVVVDDGRSLSPSAFTGARLVGQEQAGLSAARNTGISASCGRYIQFVDADDCIIPEAYQSVLEQVRKEQADIVMFRAKATAKPPCRPKASSCPSPAAEGTPPEEGREGLAEDYLLHHNLRAAAWGYAFRREILGNLRFFPGLLHEDELFTPQLLLKAKTLVELSVEAYFYRQHAGTITHTSSAAMTQKRLDDIHFVIRELHSLGNPVLGRRIGQLTVDYLQKAWTLTHSLRELRSRAKALRTEGFLPLPLRTYSARYFFACLLTRTLAL